MKSSTTCAALALCLLAALPTGAASTLDVEIEPRYFSFSSEAGTFRTSIRWGKIVVRGHDGYDVRVAARVTPDLSRAAAGATSELIDFRIEERDNLMDLIIDSRIEGFYGVDLEVLVPRETRLDLEMTAGGEIAVVNVAGEVAIANRNGSVELWSLAAAAVVDARNGSITATFARVDSGLPMSFSTLNGSIDVTLPGETAADLRVRHTYGGVESDFEISSIDGAPVAARTEGLAKGETRVLTGSINGGGPRYDFYTANGTVYLRKNT